MKKILLAVALITAASAVSCSKATNESKENGDCLKSKIENCTDSDSLQMYVTQVKNHADSLAAAGKHEDAMKYLDEMETAITKADPSLKEQLAATWESIKSTSKAATDSVGTAVNEAVDSLGNKADEAKDKIVEKAGEAKDKVAEKAEEAKDKAGKALDKGKDAVKNAADKTVEKLKNKLN